MSAIDASNSTFCRRALPEVRDRIVAAVRRPQDRFERSAVGRSHRCGGRGVGVGRGRGSGRGRGAWQWAWAWASRWELRRGFTRPVAYLVTGATDGQSRCA